MKTFLLAGCIVDTDADRETFEDVTPIQVNAFIKTLQPNEEMQLDITSYGGSVTAGLAICNLLKQASANGHKTTAHVIGIAASMASVIACACDKLEIDANAFLMCHNPWTMTMGNAGDLRKEADTLDKYRDALLAVYRTKFDIADDAIKAMLDAETWILGEQSQMFNLKAEVIPTEQPLRAAAFAKEMPKFMNTPKALKEIIMEKEEEIKQTTDEVKEEVVESKAEEPKVEEPKDEVEETAIDEVVPKAEVEKRVSGMQSTMAKKMDAMKKDYEARIADFEVQMKAKDEELAKCKAEATSLVEKLEKSAKELSEVTSALAEKSNALDALNAGVNTPNEIDAKPWKKLSGEALLKWAREHQPR